MTNTSLTERRWRHESDARRGSRLAFHNAVRKHGAAVEWWEIQSGIENLEEARSLEAQYIAELLTRAPAGYNLTDGGEGVWGHQHSDGTKQKMRVAALGRKHSAETRKKMSESRSGVAFSKDHKKNLQKAHAWRSKPVRDNNGVEYVSVRDAATKLNLHTSKVQAVLAGKRNHTGGYTFTYINKENG